MIGLSLFKFQIQIISQEREFEVAIILEGEACAVRLI
jgi:hypothetical protein